MNKISVIIQARSNSSRLRNKIFKKIGNYSLIEWVIKRVKKSNADKIILATSKAANDKILKKICSKENIFFFQGNEKDVLKRYIDAAKKFKSNIIIRVCADNPFIDPNEINNLIKQFKADKKKSDYFFNHRNFKEKTYADGFGAELFNIKLLKKISKLNLKKTHKEHVTSYIWDNIQNFRVKPCQTYISKTNHSVVADVNTFFDLKLKDTFVKKKKIMINHKAEYIASLYRNYEIDYYLNNIFNLNRSLAGEQNRNALKFLNNITKLSIKGIRSGKKVFDWRVPLEWKLNKAEISINKKKIINSEKSTLHIPSYSQPVNKTLNYKQFKKKIFLHKLSNAVPYRTFYYKKDWGFCLSKNNLKLIKSKLSRSKDKKIKVLIDSSFKNGFMNYGEILLKGKSKKEILISTYICHPSLANDNLSGVILTILLAKFLKSKDNLKWSYRIIFIPETIGAIAYIYKNLNKLKKIDTGFNITCVGGKGKFSIKKSWDEDHFVNDLVKNILINENLKFKTYDYDIHGSDERQFSYHGLGINICSLFKDKYYDYKEYHSSLDNLNFVKSNQISKSLDIYKKIINKLEEQSIFLSSNKYSEPMLSKHNLYPDVGGSILPKKDKANFLDNILWILFMCNGKKTSDQIKRKLKISNLNYNQIISILNSKKLINHV